MHIKIKNELLLINALSAILLFVIYIFPDIQPLRIALGLPFILFFPGYTLIAALFPRKTDLDPIERVALSFGLSIAVVPLIGLALNYAWSIRLTPILISLVIFIAVMSAIAWYRRRTLPEEEKLNIAVQISLPKGDNTTRLDRALTVLLIIAIIGAIGTLGYVIAKPKVGERFSEFYVLGPGGKAEGYPTQLKVGEEGKVILGIINDEHREMSYRVEIRLGNSLYREIGPVQLDHKQKWEEPVGFAPQDLSASTKLIRDVYQPYGPYPAAKTTIQVASVAHLQPGDYLSIGKESAQVQTVNGNQVTLTEPLADYHPSGEAVIEHQKVEFKLYKIRTLKNGTGQQTQLSLWLGEKGLNAGIANQGQAEATYEIGVIGAGIQDSGLGTWNSEHAIAPGQTWSPQIDFASPRTRSQEIEFSLYRDGRLLYNEKTSGSYPNLHLWIEVK